MLLPAYAHKWQKLRNSKYLIQITKRQTTTMYETDSQSENKKTKMIFSQSIPHTTFCCLPQTVATSTLS